MISYKNELYHHGIKGQRWGVRRYQNVDGTLTPEGRMRYGYFDSKRARIKKDNWYGMSDEDFKKRYGQSRKKFYLQEANKQRGINTVTKNREKLYAKGMKNKSKSFAQYKEEYIKRGFSERDAIIAAQNKYNANTALKVLGGVALAGVAAYGAYKMHEYGVASRAKDMMYDTDGIIKSYLNTDTASARSAWKYVSRGTPKDLNNTLKSNPEVKKTLLKMLDMYKKNTGGVTGKAFDKADQAIRSGKVNGKTYTTIRNMFTIPSTAARADAAVAAMRKTDAHALVTYGVAALPGAYAGIKIAGKTSEKEQATINRYRKEHPESTATDAEILTRYPRYRYL